jgi:glycosyltransferase involved in cell wall biosynthesis
MIADLAFCETVAMKRAGTSITPAVSVILCTRDRPDHIVRAIQSVLSGQWPDFEVLILDQSAGDGTRQVIMPLMDCDPRVHYHRLSSQGKTVALNRAMDLAQGPLLAFLDDDCEASPQWLDRLVGAFVGDERLMLVVGAVVAGPHDPARGFIPTFTPGRPLYGLDVLLFHDNPMGANMAMRADLARAIGPFDPVLGAGAPLRSAYDLDYCYRAYRLGRRIYADPGLMVVHHGFRTWAQGRRLVQGYAVGTAATYVKFVRIGDPVALALLLADLTRYSLRLLRQIVRCEPPLHLSALLYRLLGVAQSYHYAVDRATLSYMPPNAMPSWSLLSISGRSRGFHPGLGVGRRWRRPALRSPVEKGRRP